MNLPSYGFGGVTQGNHNNLVVWGFSGPESGFEERVVLIDLISEIQKTINLESTVIEA